MKKVQKKFMGRLKSFTPVGHRGAGGEVPGNTIESFQHLVDIFPDAIIELDVWGTRDGKIVVYHDDLLDHETDAAGPISGYTYSELLRIDRGYRVSFDGGVTYPFRNGGFKIPLLKDVLKEFPGSRMSMDIKQHDADFAAAVMKMLEDVDAVERVIAGSFNDRINKLVREYSPLTITSFGRKEVMKFTSLHRLGLTGYYRRKNDVMLIPEIISMRGEVTEDEYGHRGFRIVTEGFIRDAHKLGIPVFIWTINRKENMRRLIDWGVDGLVTDYPTRLKEVMIEAGLTGDDS